ncbi:MAG: hypothetical protein WC030_00710 [Candidatus Paceibacterota bacterium]
MEEQVLKIFVFDDSPANRRSAEITLAGHDLTIVGTYDEAQDALVACADYDVVLTDLMVPASAREQGSTGRALVGQEMPIGTTIALLAVMLGVKNVCVFSNMNHHHHPAVAALDVFWEITAQRTTAKKVVNIQCYSGDEGMVDTDLGKGKNWASVLRHLMTW